MPHFTWLGQMQHMYYETIKSNNVIWRWCYDKRTWILDGLQGSTMSFSFNDHDLTTRETVTTATEIQQQTVEGLCGFGRVVGVIL